MVSFFDTYSGEEFKKFAASLPLPEIVQPKTAQLETANEIVQFEIAQFEDMEIVQTPSAQFQEIVFEPIPQVLTLSYLEALDRDVKHDNENPSIGIILCPSADKSMVEYTLSRSLSPTMVSEYKRKLIPQEVLTRSLDEYCSFVNLKNLL